jgi:hypothetical protein
MLTGGMQTQARPAPPDSSDGDSEVTFHRRRAPRWLTAALASVLIATTLGGWLWALRYRPLTNSLGTAPRFAYQIRPKGDPSAVDVWAIEHHPGATTSFALTLTNDGGRGITLTGIDLPPMTLLRQTGVHVGPFRLCCGAPYARVPAFAASSLPPKASMYVVIAARFTGCELVAAGALDTVDHVVIHFRVFGIPRSEVVSLNRAFVVVSPPDTACPARSGARGA